MSNYSPSSAFNVPMFLCVPTATKVKGVNKKVYVPNTEPFFGSFRTFGGTEKVVNDVIVLEDTATIETWFDPSIKADCQLLINDQHYEILGTPENIQMRNQYMFIKVRAIKGGA